MSCEKIFKNSTSLATHKHRYHPYSPRSRKSITEYDEISSVISDISVTSSRSLGNIKNNELEKRINENRKNIDSLDWAFDSIKEHLEALEFKLRLQYFKIDTKLQEGGATLKNNDVSKISREVQTIKLQSDLNKGKIDHLRKQIQDI